MGVVTAEGTPSPSLTTVSTASLRAVPNLFPDAVAEYYPVEAGFDALSTRLEAADATYLDVARVAVV